MSDPTEGYVLHAYGAERYVQHAVASVVTLRRHDAHRPVALYCTKEQRDALRKHGLDTLFERVVELPVENRSIVGFKHAIYKFKPYDRSLFVDADMVWCRNPDALWQQMAAFPFTATGLERADFFFGGPKGFSVAFDFLFDRRRRTMRAFGLSHLPRVQAGMIYAQNDEVTRLVCESASSFLERQTETHFQSRLNEGRSEETCEWSLAMAMSRLRLPVFTWFQGYNSPQLDFIEGLTQYDPDFEHVLCRYYCDRFVYSLRGLRISGVRDAIIRIATSMPGRGDYLDVTPYVMHFGWLRHKQPFFDFSDRVWKRLTSATLSGDGAGREPIVLPSELDAQVREAALAAR